VAGTNRGKMHNSHRIGAGAMGFVSVVIFVVVHSLGYNECIGFNRRK
jgi:hypothetical protein